MWTLSLMYLWADRIDLACGLWLPRVPDDLTAPARGVLGAGRTRPRVRIAVARLPGRVLGRYHFGRELVEMNALRLDRPAGDVIATLAHELIHCWEDHWAGDPRPGNWHTDAFIARARRHGLAVDRDGCQRLVPGGPFARFLGRHGVAAP